MKKYTDEEKAVYVAHREFVKELLERAHGDVAIHRLDHLSFHILWFLTNIKYLKSPNKQMFAGPTSLAKEMGSSRSPIQRALRELELAGYLVLVSKGRRGYSKATANSYKLGDGRAHGVGEEKVPGDLHCSGLKVPGDLHPTERRSQEGFTAPREGPRRPPSILEASDSISEVDPTRTTKDGRRDDDPDDHEDQLDASACSGPSGPSPGPAGSFTGWNDRPSDRADPESLPTDQDVPADVMKLFGVLVDRDEQARRRERISIITRQH